MSCKMAGVVQAFIICLLVVLSLAQMDDSKGPKIVIEPADKIVDADSVQSTVTLSCIAEGDAVLTYQWRRNYLPLQTTSDISMSGGQLRIARAQKTRDEGVYECRVTNDVGTVFSRLAYLSFAYVNSFSPIARPSRSVNEYEDIVLECSAPDHYPGLDYRWKLGDEYIPGDDRVRIGKDGNLYFANALAGPFGDAGDYYCEIRNSVRNPSGASTRLPSPKIPLQVISASRDRTFSPQVIQPVGTHNVLKGESVTLQCFFSGRPTPNLSWSRKDGSSLPRGAYQNAYGQELVIPNIQLEDGGNYQCTASNDVQSGITNVGLVTVRSLPEWVSEIQDQNGDINGEIHWLCEADSTDPITYTWYRNGTPLQGDTKHVVSNGQKMLTVKSLTQDDDAMYQCIAENDFGLILSTAQLNVRAIVPTFHIPVKQQQPAARGDNATLICRPESAPKATIVWQRERVLDEWDDIANNNKFKVDAESGDLVIFDVTSGDTGRYRCVATNSLGTGSSIGSIVVKNGVYLSVTPVDKTIRVGTSHEIECQATADKTLDIAYTWLFNGQPIHLDNEDHEDEDDGHYVVDMEMIDSYGYLLIKETTMYQEGEYTCIATSTINQVTASAMIYVKGPPGAPAGVRVQVDGSSTTATEVKLFWSAGRNGRSPITSYIVEGMTNHNSEWMELRKDIEPTISNDGRVSVTLSDLSPWSSYMFRVIAVNQYGAGDPSDPSPEYTTPQGAPSVAPRNVGGGGGREGQLRITWEPLALDDWNAPSIQYKVFWTRMGTIGQDQQQSDTVENGTIGVFVTEGVETYIEYTVQVQAINANGEGPKSVPVNILSFQKPPTVAPTNVKLIVKSANSIQASWSAINSAVVDGEFKGYKVAYWPSNMMESTAELYTTSGTVAVIENLAVYTSYMVTVYAYSGGGKGPKSRVATGRTLKSAPLTAPSEVNVSVGEDYNQLIVKWKAITTSSNEEPLKGYKVYYWPLGTFEDDARSVEVNVPKTEVMLNKLIPSSVYLIKVKGFSKGGVGIGQDEPMRVTNDPEAARLSSNPANILHQSLVLLLTAIQLYLLL